MSSEEKNLPVGFQRWIIVLTAISAAILELIDTSIVNVALREISGSLGATITEIAWVITAYAISNVIIIPLTGMLSDLFGRKTYFTVSIIIFTLSSAMCGASTGLWELVFWRFIQGLGGGALLSTSQTIIYDAFPRSQINTATAIFGIGVIIGPTFGPTLGGFITDNYNWHWIFYINVPIGVTAAILSWTYIKNREGSKRPGKIDWTGIALLVIGVGAFQYVLEEGTAKDWFDSNEISLFSAISVLGLALFIWWELKVKEPAVNLKLLRNWNLSVGSFLNLILGMILMSTVFVFPLFVQTNLGWTASQTGNFMIPGALASAVAMPMSGKLLNKGLHPRILILIGIALTFTFTTLMSFSAPGSSEANFFIPFILRGFGIAFMMMPILGSALNGINGADMAQAMGLRNMVRQLGGAIGVAVMNIYLSSKMAYNNNYLAQNINQFSEAVQDRLMAFSGAFIGAGYDKGSAEQLGYKMLDFTLAKQQALVTYDNVFWSTGLFVLMCLPFVFLMKFDRKAKATAGGDH